MTANIVVLIALAEEHDVFTELFPPLSEDVSTSRNVRLRHEIEHDEFTLTSVLATEMGADAATDSIYSCLSDLEPDLVVCLGIAGSLSSDANLADVCVSNKIIDVLHNSKIADVPTRRRRIAHGQSKTRVKAPASKATTLQLSSRSFSVVPNLQAACRFLRSHPLQSNLYQALLDGFSDRWERLSLKHDLAALGILNDQVNEFHVGPIVCGPVSVSREFNNQLKDIDRKVLAIETESGGVFRVCADKGIPALTIRGISDKADKNKSTLETSLKSDLRYLAMQNACAFLQAMLKNKAFLDEASRHASQRTETKQMPSDDSSPQNHFRVAQDAINTYLEKASADFKSRPVSAPLPLPRIRRASLSEAVGDADETPLSIFDALSEDRRVFIKIPRSYPEKHLAWYVAASLLNNEIDGKQILPVVLDADAVTPPRRTLRNEIGEALWKALDDPTFRSVLIVSEPDFDSATKSHFLTQNLAELGSIPIIVVSKAESPIETIDAFKIANGLTEYLTASMPLAEIANYLEKAFDMVPEEADVVATRLDDTFSKFRLHTHPAYFIGLQETVLDDLIAANQRAELIQLAVDGILTFVVANDSSLSKLSRTSREEFLSELSFAMRVRKESFTKVDLIGRAESFGKRKALELDPIEFVRGFFLFGLLNDVGGKVEFSLPFLEAFLLSELLRMDPGSAKEYFNPSQDDFDQFTFDLYCELGADECVVNHIVEFAVNALSACEDVPNILSGKAVVPRALSSSAAMVALAKQMGEATEKMTGEPSSPNIRQEKQRLVDAREAVSERVGAEKNAIRKAPPEEAKAEFKMLDDLSISCTLLATMIGSGAERLEGVPKRRIAALLLTSSERFLHMWTKNRNRINFDHIRQNILSDDSIKGLIETLDLFEDRQEEVRKSLSLFVDDQELRLLTGPLATILHRTAIYAGVRNLRPVVTSAKPKNNMEEILRAVWLMEIDANLGKDATKKAFRGFKGASLVRLTTASHFMWRIFWHHWRMGSRVSFAETAKAVLAPMGLVTADEHKSKMLSGHRSS